jgi:hypothetical protein
MDKSLNKIKISIMSVTRILFYVHHLSICRLPEPIGREQALVSVCVAHSFAVQTIDLTFWYQIVGLSVHL